MTSDRPDDAPAAPDASDVITGSAGNARLRDPASSGPEGANLDRLPSIDGRAGESDRAALLPTQTSNSNSDSNAAIRQLEAIIQNLTTYATPVIREIAARAAELAAKAGEAAGPVAHKVAGVTEEAGGRLAARGHEIASGLRSDGAAGDSVTPAESSTSPDRPSSS